MVRVTLERAMWWLAALQVVRVWWDLYQRAAIEPIRPKRSPDPLQTYEALSIVIPARNEASTIEACLSGATAQAHPNLEIVVVDDRSEDGTADLVRNVVGRDPRVRVILGQPLPAGWVGKCWALHQGTQAARGEWLLFVDADTRLRPGAALGAVDEAMRRGAAVLSALTAQELPTAWERIVQPAVFMALAEAMPIRLVNNPNVPEYALANGQFLLVRRDAYDAIGGHAAIRAEIAEDAQFARRAKQLRWPLWLGDGRLLATTRMYETPIALWEGWTKNLHVGARLLPWLIPPGVALQLLTLVAPWVGMVLGMRKRSPALACAGATQLLASLLIRRIADAMFGVPAKYMLAQPLGQGAFIALLLSSFFKVLSGQGVTWKGRRYTG